MSVVQQVTGTFSASYSASEQIAFGLVSADIAQASDGPSINFTNGNGAAGVIDLHWEKGLITPISLAASASVTYTLSALTDELGRTVAFARVCAFLLRVLTVTAGDYLTITPGVTNGWTAMVTGTGVKVKRVFLAIDDTGGFLVTSGSNDQITITNNGTHTITFLLALAGAST